MIRAKSQAKLIGVGVEAKCKVCLPLLIKAKCTQNFFDGGGHFDFVTLTNSLDDKKGIDSKDEA